MKIVLNLTCINNNPSGARNRIKFLYYYLIKNNPDYKFYILEPKDSNIQSLFNGCKNIEFIKTKCLSYNSIQRFLLGRLTIPNIIEKIQPDIYEQFHLPLIELKNVKIICTIHDIRYSSHLKQFVRPRFISNFFLKKALQKSHKIITVSKSLQKDIKKFTKFNNIEYAYNVLDQRILLDKGKNKKNFNINEDFILSVGVIEDRKNYDTLLKSAYLIKNIHPNIKFYIVGSKTKYAQKLYKKMKLMNLENNIFFLHNVNDDELSALYQRTKLFLFPSKYEGFGIPVLEAISYQCKILLSDIEVFKELTDNKVSYFEKDSCEDLTYHILNVLNKSRSIKENYELDKKVLENYTPKKITNKIIKLYESCVA